MTDDSNVSIPNVKRPWLSEPEGFNFPNHNNSSILPSESQVKVNDSSVNVTDSSVTNYDSAKESSSVCNTPLHSLEKLAGVESVSGPKTIKSILKSCSTRTDHRTCDHAEYMNSMNISQHLKSQGESSSRSQPLRPLKPFPPCEHYRRGEALQAKKTKSSNATRSKTPNKRSINQEKYTLVIVDEYSRYQVDSNVVQFIEPYERPEPIFTKVVASLDQNDQADQNDQRLGELTPTKLIIELADRTIKRPKDMPEDIKVPLILGIPFFSTAHAKIDVFKRKITLRVGDDKILRRNQEVDDLGSKIEEGEVIDEPKMDIINTRNDDEMIDGIDEYPSFCDFDRKIHIDFVENIDAFRDKDMGEVIVGKPFCRDICVKARQFDGFITIGDGNDS
ncbi:hypothetical protein Tco_1082582 [Tanacetum coccineum]|uniref:Reverse transcriptase domain-containing protein n=1 Tax=Tanacetum coccineum TaxID=301880 RepID=A0ABQ5I0W7_9ASTR